MIILKIISNMKKNSKYLIIISLEMNYKFFYFFIKNNFLHLYKNIIIFE